MNIVYIVLGSILVIIAIIITIHEGKNWPPVI